MQKFQVAFIGLNNLFGKISSLLLKQSPYIRCLKLYDDTNIAPALDVSDINTNCKVKAFLGRDQLNNALNEVDVVIIGDEATEEVGNPDQIFISAADKLVSYANAISSSAPAAIVILAASPLNTLLPILTKVLAKNGNYNYDKIFGSTAADNVCASCTLASYLKVDPKHVVLPVIGGSSENTRVPVLSQAKPNCNLPQEVKEQILKDIAERETNILAKKGKRESLNKAYANIKFLNSVFAGLRGETNIIDIVMSKTDIVRGAEYFSLPVVLGKDGISKRFGVPKLSIDEQCLLSSAIKNIKQEINKADAFIDGTYVFINDSCTTKLFQRDEIYNFIQSVKKKDKAMSNMLNNFKSNKNNHISKQNDINIKRCSSSKNLIILKQEMDIQENKKKIDLPVDEENMRARKAVASISYIDSLLYSCDYLDNSNGNETSHTFLLNDNSKLKKKNSHKKTKFAEKFKNIKYTVDDNSFLKHLFSVSEGKNIKRKDEKKIENLLVKKEDKNNKSSITFNKNEVIHECKDSLDKKKEIDNKNNTSMIIKKVASNFSVKGVTTIANNSKGTKQCRHLRKSKKTKMSSEPNLLLFQITKYHERFRDRHPCHTSLSTALAIEGNQCTKIKHNSITLQDASKYKYSQKPIKTKEVPEASVKKVVLQDEKKNNPNKFKLFSVNSATTSENLSASSKISDNSQPEKEARQLTVMVSSINDSNKKDADSSISKIDTTLEFPNKNDVRSNNDNNTNNNRISEFTRRETNSGVDHVDVKSSVVNASNCTTADECLELNKAELKPEITNDQSFGYKNCNNPQETSTSLGSMSSTAAIHGQNNALTMENSMSLDGNKCMCSNHLIKPKIFKKNITKSNYVLLNDTFAKKKIDFFKTTENMVPNFENKNNKKLRRIDVLYHPNKIKGILHPPKLRTLNKLNLLNSSSNSEKVSNNIEENESSSKRKTKIESNYAQNKFKSLNLLNSFQKDDKIKDSIENKSGLEHLYAKTVLPNSCETFISNDVGRIVNKKLSKSEDNTEVTVNSTASKPIVTKLHLLSPSVKSIQKMNAKTCIENNQDMGASTFNMSSKPENLFNSFSKTLNKEGAVKEGTTPPNVDDVSNTCNYSNSITVKQEESASSTTPNNNERIVKSRTVNKLGLLHSKVIQKNNSSKEKEINDPTIFENSNKDSCDFESDNLKLESGVYKNNEIPVLMQSKDKSPETPNQADLLLSQSQKFKTNETKKEVYSYKCSIPPRAKTNNVLEEDKTVENTNLPPSDEKGLAQENEVQEKTALEIPITQTASKDLTENNQMLYSNFHNVVKSHFSGVQNFKKPPLIKNKCYLLSANKQNTYRLLQNKIKLNRCSEIKEDLKNKKIGEVDANRKMETKIFCKHFPLNLIKKKNNKIASTISMKSKISSGKVKLNPMQMFNSTSFDLNRNNEKKGSLKTDLTSPSTTKSYMNKTFNQYKKRKTYSAQKSLIPKQTIYQRIAKKNNNLKKETEWRTNISKVGTKIKYKKSSKEKKNIVFKNKGSKIGTGTGLTEDLSNMSGTYEKNQAATLLDNNSHGINVLQKYNYNLQKKINNFLKSDNWINSEDSYLKMYLKSFDSFNNERMNNFIFDNMAVNEYNKFNNFPSLKHFDQMN